MSNQPERRFVSRESAVQIETREDGEGERIVGLASVFYDGTPDTEFHLFDNLYERISPSAFDKVIAEKFDTRALFNHNPDHVLGRRSAGSLTLEKRPEGLGYEIEPKDTQRYRDTLEDVRSGDVTGSSFSFTVEKEAFESDGDRDIRTIESVAELFDVGPVTFPAYEASTAGVRAAGDLAEVRSSHETWRGEQAALERRRKHEERLRRVSELEKDI